MGGDGHHGRRQWHAARAAHEVSRVAEQGSVGWEAERSVALSERSLSEGGGGVEELPRCGPTVRHGAVEGGCA
jgi:hypothetical protein